MKKNLTAWPIDNKHVLEDFTDELHDGRFVERTNKGIVRQAFYDGPVLWEVCYRFGDSKFELHLRGGDIDSEHYLDKMKAKVLALADEENGLYVQCVDGYETGSLYGQFLKEVE